MNTVYNNTKQINLQSEIAILQKDILAFIPCYAKLSIPALLGNDMDTYLEIPMPLHLSVTYGNKIIPKGTKLIVQSVAGNYNELKIIGFYEDPKPINFIEYISKYINKEESIYPEDYDETKFDIIKEV